MHGIRVVLLATVVGMFLLSVSCGKKDQVEANRSGTANQMPVKANQSVKELTRTLEKGNYYQKCDAAKALAAVGKSAKPAVGALVDLLGAFDAERAAKDEQPLMQAEGIGVFSADPPKVGEEAARALVSIGEPAVGEIARAVESDQLGVRLRAAEVLGNIGPDAKKGVSALVTMLKRAEYFQDRETAAKALGRIGPSARQAIPALEAALKDDTYNVRDEAARALGSIGSSRAVPPLAALLEAGPTVPDRRNAVVNLGRLGAEAGSSVQAIVALLDSDGEAQKIVSSALAGIGAQAIPAVMAELPSRNATRKLAAIDALRLMGPAAKNAVPGLLGILKDSYVRECAKGALAAIGSEAVPAILSAMKSGDSDVRMVLVETLGDMGESAAAAIPQLGELARQGSDQERASAIKALCMVGGSSPAVQEILAAAMKDQDFVTRNAAIEGIGAMGAKGAGMAPTLVAVLADTDSRFRTAAAQSLAKIGAAALPAVMQALKDSRANVRESAANALGEMGPAAAGAVATLAGITRDPDETVRYEVVQALGQIGQEPAAAVPALERVLQADSSMMVRCEAARVLGEFGPRAASAIPSLKKVAGGDHAGLQSAATESLRKIETNPPAR